MPFFKTVDSSEHKTGLKFFFLKWTFVYLIAILMILPYQAEPKINNFRGEITNLLGITPMKMHPEDITPWVF